jgi:hypothetical protein
MAADQAFGGQRLVGGDDRIPIDPELSREIAGRGEAASRGERSGGEGDSDRIRDLAIDRDLALPIDSDFIMA